MAVVEAVEPTGPPTKAGAGAALVAAGLAERVATVAVEGAVAEEETAGTRRSKSRWAESCAQASMALGFRSLLEP